MRPPRERPSRARADPEAFASRALDFRVLVADSSSLIVLAEIGLLASALARWRLSTAASVIAELRTGRKVPGGRLNDEGLFGAIRIIDGPEEKGADGKPLSTDAALLSLALRAGLPLLSEDGRMLRAAEEGNMDCLDSLVALELLQATGAISREQADACLLRLRSRSIVSPARAAWAGEVGQAAAKFG